MKRALLVIVLVALLCVEKNAQQMFDSAIEKDALWLYNNSISSLTNHVCIARIDHSLLNGFEYGEEEFHKWHLSLYHKTGRNANWSIGGSFETQKFFLSESLRLRLWGARQITVNDNHKIGLSVSIDWLSETVDEDLVEADPDDVINHLTSEPYRRLMPMIVSTSYSNPYFIAGLTLSPLLVESKLDNSEQIIHLFNGYYQYRIVLQSQNLSDYFENMRSSKFDLYWFNLFTLRSGSSLRNFHSAVEFLIDPNWESKVKFKGQLSINQRGLGAMLGLDFPHKQTLNSYCYVGVGNFVQFNNRPTLDNNFWTRQQYLQLGANVRFNALKN